MFNAPTHTPDPNATATPVITATLVVTPTLEPAAAAEAPAAAQAEPTLAPTAPPPPTPTVPLAEPLRGGEWDFEVGFRDWGNPHGDPCGGSGLANGWSAFTTRDQYGSSCMNQTTWKDNVYSGESAQEITFAYIGNEAGIFKTAPTIAGHRYTVEAFMRREFSPVPVEVALGIDLTGGTNWQAESVQWFPWNEDRDDQWARTEVTIAAAGENHDGIYQGIPRLSGAGGDAAARHDQHC